MVFKNQDINDEEQVLVSRQFSPLLPAHQEVWERHAKDYNPLHRPDRTKPEHSTPSINYIKDGSLLRG